VKQPGDRAAAPPWLALAQDLVNTVDLEQGIDRLAEPADLTAFVKAHGLPSLAMSRRDLARCLEFREALRGACLAHAGLELPPSSTGVLDRELARAQLLLAIDRAGAGSVTVRPVLRGFDSLVAHLAAGIVMGLADGTWLRLKACAAVGCRWVYYDHSPAGRGRWCTMQICGSRAKVSTYRQRQRTQERVVDATPTTPRPAGDR
jgi:predicted RNA-binding Zn ribbon-like protein